MGRFNCAMLALPAFVACVMTTGACAAPTKAAIFKFELVDVSEEGSRDGVRPDQTARLDRIQKEIEDRLKTAGLELVPVPADAPAVKDVRSVRECPTCVTEATKALGADLSVFGFVQKVSNVAINITLEIRDQKSGKVLRAGSADIRGNTDEMWDHGASYLMRNRILKTPLPVEGAQ